MRLLLVRHGQTPANVDFLLHTAVPGAGLTALGGDVGLRMPEARAGRRCARGTTRRCLRPRTGPTGRVVHPE
ncbi:hypothetical protein AQJ67_03710 [Streptomyces caeruleatus]|uniref:Phosphoglycerate mutase n=1 Tax=Streptomyces caeruleatus TaxID=661399 RepID=A0A124IAK0_9ACTN|nr:hypothetical protein AQJ67_03710 [Streptomyces caeruleatus]